MGHKYTREQILEAALAAAVDEGLSQLTFGRLAKRMGISDRIVVYYFPTKNDLITSVIMSMGIELQQTLDGAISGAVADHLQLAKLAWPLVASGDADPVFALFFEANGLAAAGREPYRTLVPQLVEGFIEWAAANLQGSAKARRSEAEAAIALIDGLLLLRIMIGPKAADRAAVKLGVA